LAKLYSYEIDWNSFSKKTNLIKEKKHKNFKTVDYDYKTKYSTQKKETKINFNQKNFSFLYGLLFFIIVIFLFFLSISLSFASNISDTTLEEYNIFQDTNSSNLVKDYLISENNKQIDKNLNKTNVFQFKVITYSKYRVRKNETFENIAKKFGLESDSIILCNFIKKKINLRAGTILLIPNQDGRIISVNSNDSIQKIANRYGASWEKIVDVNNLTSSKLEIGQKLFIPDSKMTNYEKNQYETPIITYIWPIKGKLTSYFGPRIDPFKGTYGYHTGIDIKNDMGTPVKASMNGFVIFTGFDNIYGNNIILKHSNGITTRYGHLQTVLVKKGDQIKQSQKIGTVGSTGRSTGAHLHFEIRKYGKLIDPLKILSN